MSTGKARDNEAELAALLEEVRALRRDIEVLKANPAIARAVGEADEELMISADRDLPPNYAVAVRAAKLPPNYAVAVRTAKLPPDYAVAVRATKLPPDYAVAVRATKLPPDYAVAVRSIPKLSDEPVIHGAVAEKSPIASKAQAAKKGPAKKGPAAKKKR